MNFGDIDVTAIVDCGISLQGLEGQLADALNRIKQSGTGECRLRIQRAGIDHAPVAVKNVEASYFIASSPPGAWVAAISNKQGGPRHIVVLFMYSEDPCYNAKQLLALRDKLVAHPTPGVYRITVGHGLSPGVFSRSSCVEPSFSILSAAGFHGQALNALVENINSVRLLPGGDNPRIPYKLSFRAEQKRAAFPETLRNKDICDRVSGGYLHNLLTRLHARAKTVLSHVHK